MGDVDVIRDIIRVGHIDVAVDVRLGDINGIQVGGVDSIIHNHVDEPDGKVSWREDNGKLGHKPWTLGD